MLISDNLPVRKIYFDSNIIYNENAKDFSKDYFEADVDRSTCFHAKSLEHFDATNVIYHKFSHGPVSYTLNGENVNVMLE